MSFTRIQYLKKECTFEQYYDQFITDVFIARVRHSIGTKRLLDTKGDLSKIPLEEWDKIRVPFGTADKMKRLGDTLTLSGQVCIAKRAAKIFIKRH